MFKKDIYKYKIDNRTVVSTHKPDCEYEHMYRLIAQSEDFLITDFVVFTSCIDVLDKDLELWHEVHKDDLETPVSQNEEIQTMVSELTKIGKLVANQVTDDAVALELQTFYDEWQIGVNYSLGQYVRYNGVLYKVVNAHSSQSDWAPDISPSLFTVVLTSPDGTPQEWVQPDSTNPYMKGDKVIFEGVVYESLIDNNIWSPAAYPAGWQIIEG